MVLNDCGKMVEKAWLDLPRHYPLLELSEFVVMPDHFHGVLFLVEGAQPSEDVRKPDLSEIIGRFKLFSARRINLIRGTQNIPVWQRGYYDRIICNQTELEMTCAYIALNPERWGTDNEYPTSIH